MKQPQFIILLLISFSFVGCSWFISDEQRSELTQAVVEARIDSISSWYEQEGRPADYQRVILLQGEHVNQRIADSIRKQLFTPFEGLRTDSTLIEITKGTAENKDGEVFEYIDEVKDRETNIPIKTMIVDSIQVISPWEATLHLYEADNKSTHYIGLKWWLKKENGKWRPDSVLTIWEN